MIASHFGYKLFDADTIDGLTVEQYNMLVELFNQKAGSQVDHIEKQKYSTKLVTINGKKDIDYGDD